MRRSLYSLSLLVVLVIGGGCNNNRTLKEENALLKDENQTLRGQLDDRNTALESANRELRDKEVELADLRQQLGSMETMTAAAVTGFEGISGVSGSVGVGEITATVESDVLFSPGKAELKDEAKRTLDQVAQVLNSTHAGRTVRIAGHTDTDPIRKSGYKSNYHLGFERAYAVREYLTSRGVAEQRVYLASYGPDEPMPTKAESRRVELVVVTN